MTSKEPNQTTNILYSNFNSTLGSVIAVTHGSFLVLLEFEDNPNLQSKIERLKKRIGVFTIENGQNEILNLVENEMIAYFKGNLLEFTIPVLFFGTDFQKLAWQELLNISYGQTRSYKEQAVAIGRPTAYRAVAGANSDNLVAIIVPCHRVINNNGGLSGYSSGVARKKWLIDHERACSS